MRLRRTLLSLSILAATGQALASEQLDANQWSKIEHVSTTDNRTNFKAQTFSQHSVSMTTLKDALSQSSPKITLPLPSGEFVTFQLKATEVMSPGLAARYPNIKTFEGFDVENPHNKGRFDLTPSGFHGMYYYEDAMVMFDPASSSNSDDYVSYYKKDALPITPLISQQQPVEKLNFNPQLSESFEAKALPQRKRYRLAVSASGEYTAFHGGTKESGLAAIVTMVNRINQVYSTDMNIEFQLVENNDDIIFTNASTDPFENTDGDIDLNQAVVDDAIGSANYDIGHIVNTAGGGLAAFGSACVNGFKAEGVTGSGNPVNDFFWIDFVSHELGHQLRASHTFSANSGACSSGTVARDSAYEVGSGSTIMGYASLCGAQDIQSAAHDNFHIRSIDQMTNYLTSGAIASCGEVLTQSNAEPVVDAGANFTIPANTPFTLVGSATDTDGDTLSYSWEQFDLADYDDLSNTAIGPLFRVFAPMDNGARTFPQLSDVLNGTTTFGERLPDQAREMNFRLVVRDGNGGLNDDAMVVTVVNSDGFSVTAPTDSTSWNGAQQTVLWNTGDTESAPVSCEQVNILLSSDSGTNFNTTLVTNTPNDGNQTVTLPTLNTDTARVKVECSNNVFFAVNTGDFSVTSDGNPDNQAPVITGQNPISVDEDASVTLSADMFTIEGDTVDSIAITAGENYTVEGLTLTPSTNFNGALTVAVTATRGGLTSAAFNANVTVNAVNDIPVAVNDSLTVDQGADSTAVNVLDNDTDIDGDTLSITNVAYSGSGTVSFTATSVSYAPAADFSGTESVSYEISDGNGGTATGTLNIQVNESAPPPTPPAPTPTSSGGGGSVGWLWLLAGMTAIFRRVKP